MSEDYTDNTTHCCICMEQCEKPDITCPSCKSVFHKECWDEAKVLCTCPYCRNILFDTKSLFEYIKALSNKHNNYLMHSLALEWVMSKIIMLSHITPKHPYIIQLFRDEPIYEIKPLEEMDKYEKYIQKQYWISLMTIDTIIPVSFPITEKSLRDIKDRYTSKLCDFGNNTKKEVIDLMTDEAGDVIEFDSIWENPEKMKQLITYGTNILRSYFPRYDNRNEYECKFDEEIKFKCRDCDGIIFKNNKCVNCGREYDNQCCALCKHQSELVTTSFDYKLQKHRVRKSKRFDELIYCKECKRAYVVYSSNGEIKKHTFINEVDPPYELIKDDWNATHIFEYSNSLKSRLIPDARISKLLQLANADLYKINKFILKELLKKPLPRRTNKWAQNKSIVVQKLFLPHLIVKDNEALILRVLNGDNPAVLDKVYKILEAYGFKI